MRRQGRGRGASLRLLAGGMCSAQPASSSWGRLCTGIGELARSPGFLCSFKSLRERPPMFLKLRLFFYKLGTAIF